MKALIVDDERLSRRALRGLLGHLGVSECEEASSLKDAIDALTQERFDLVFLDIQLRGETGFELFERAGQLELPPVIFVTAYDSYAVRAFEVNALDYLMKPVALERLQSALDRAKQRTSPPKSRVETPSTGVGGAALTAPATELSKLSPEDLIFCEEGGKARFVRVSEVVLIQAAGNYTEIGLQGGVSVLVLKPLLVWEQQLPERQFVRVHRSTIVNVSFIREITRESSSSHSVTLQGWPRAVQLSRRRATELRSRLGV
ncbi:MAG: response regulator transcription factor [Polyangiaceae bacterium]|nr:response regulator transcription factor [Myxococcales bacterium]MCB9588007.1 response regulator transcription factor [Polyangiaceae bacterium]